MMKNKKYFLNKFIFAIYHKLLLKDNILSIQKEFEQNQWKTNDELTFIQQKKLCRLLNHAVTNVDYYRNVYKGTLKELEEPYTAIKRFPFLTKRVIKNQFENLQSDDIEKYKPVKSSTSGSCGENTFFLHCRNWTTIESVILWRAFEWSNIQPFDARASLWGAKFDDKKKNGIMTFIKQRFMPSYFFSSYDLSEQNLELLSQCLINKKIKLLVSYPSPLSEFAKYVKSYNKSYPDLKAIICSAEQLFDHQRKLFDSVFGVPVYNRYGSREFGLIAHECEKHTGLHVVSDHLYIEILDESGKECLPGQSGELYITDLDNFAMPFIRYKIGDLASWSSKQCTCGRNFPLLEKIDGRSFDLIRTPSGNTISGTFWTILTRYISEDIAAFQVHQTNINSITIFIVTHSRNNLPVEREQQLKQEINRQAPGIQVIIKYVDSIPLTRSGKKRFVISELNND